MSELQDLKDLKDEADTTLHGIADLIKDAGPDASLIVRILAESNRHSLAAFERIAQQQSDTVERVAQTMQASVASIVGEMKQERVRSDKRSDENRAILVEVRGEQAALKASVTEAQAETSKLIATQTEYLRGIANEQEHLREDHRTKGASGGEGMVRILADTLGSTFKTFAIISVVAVAVIGSVASAKFAFDAGIIGFESGESADSPELQPPETE